MRLILAILLCSLSAFAAVPTNTASMGNFPTTAFDPTNYLLGVTRSGTNFQTKLFSNIWSKLVMKPSSYGAVGDGVTDDTTALLATVNAANLLRGSTIDLDGKSYLVTTTLRLTNTDMTIERGKLLTANNTNILWLSHDRQTVRNVALAGPGNPRSE